MLLASGCYGSALDPKVLRGWGREVGGSKYSVACGGAVSVCPLGRAVTVYRMLWSLWCLKLHSFGKESLGAAEEAYV